MRKKLIMSILIITVALSLPFMVYGAYTGIRYISGLATSGAISINTDSKNFIVYTTLDDPTTTNVDETVTVSCLTETDNPTYSIRNGRIDCFATEKTGSAYEESYYQLNQLGLAFAFSNSIDVYVRVRIEDSWISTKTYRNGTIRRQIILKEVSALNDALDTNYWVYDEKSGYIYYKIKVDASASQTTLEIKFDDEYFYTTTPNNSYNESVVASISYEIDIVQANRAATKWNVDLNSIIGG